MLEFRILGPVTMMRDGRPVNVPQQARTVLAQLLLAEERAVSTDRLMDALWGERVPSSARAAMHNLVAALRRALGEDADMLTTQPPGYALRYGSRATFDLQEFEAEIDQGRQRARIRQPRASRSDAVHCPGALAGRRACRSRLRVLGDTRRRAARGAPARGGRAPHRGDACSGAEHQGDRRDPFASGCPSTARVASRPAPAGTR